jgi:iron complex outermembrane receptor protein
LFWDVNYANGINKASASFVQGAIDMRKLQRALGPIADCTDTCVPLNLFGVNSVTPEMLKYIQYDAVDRSQNKIQLFTANLSGEIFDLPAGPFSFAAGGEHRKYSGYFIPNPLTAAGDDGSIPVPPTSGSYSISEGYLELHIPVLADVPFFKALDVSAATRYSDYSNFGGTTNSKLGVRWQVVNDLTLRSTVALGFRAPALGELYAPPSGFGATLLDPCTEPVANAQTEANCRALGVPAGFQQNNTQITVNTGGNANLKPETSHSVTAGAVYSPSWITGMGWADRFDISLNYYKIKITNAIAALDSQTVLNTCVASGSATSEFCKDIHRTPSGDSGLWNKAPPICISCTLNGYDASTYDLPSRFTYVQARLNF